MSDNTNTDEEVDTGIVAGTGHRGSDVAIASQWQLIWWSFRRHKLAMVGLWVIGLFYLLSLFAEFFAAEDPGQQNRRAVFHPPQMIHFIDRTEDGWAFRPYVYEMDRQRDPDTLAISYEPSGEKIYLRLFGKGEEYRMWGLWDMNIHFLATVEPRKNFYLFGADRRWAGTERWR